MPLSHRRLLGEVLVEAGLITGEQLQEGLRRQAQTGMRLGQALIDLGYISEEKLAKTLEQQLGIARVQLRKTPIEQEAAQLISETLAQRYKVIPIKKKGRKLTLAMVDPLNVYAMDDIRAITGYEIDPVMATEKDLDWAIKQHLSMKEAIVLAEQEDSQEEVAVAIEQATSQERIRALVEEGPIVGLVNSIIFRAVLNRASDIHVEPQEKEVVVRYRVDGILFETMTLQKKMQAAVLSRLKIMADMDIAERRIPQDGRIQMTVEDREIDFRVSSLPTIYGEKMVLRILDKTQGVRSIKELDYADGVLERVQRIVRKPYGIILVTGPTGSGKSTTLYAYLNHLNSIDKNIVTVEDPVEYTLPRVNQVQVNTKSGMTFAKGLRSILRQDPDIIMIGEIRDQETAQIAVRSALTGHLVLSTLHTNSAVASLTRLVDMGVEPFLMSSTVVGIVSQRLVRSICPDCKESYTITPEVAQSIGLANTEDEEYLTYYRGKGCHACNHTGYRGRLAIHEVLDFTSDFREAVVKGASESEILALAKERGFWTLKEDGLAKARQGLTTIEEVLKVVFWQD